MPKGIMIVESRPASPEEAEAYHRWYEDVHIPELLGVDGFVSARRLTVDEGDSFVAVYEVDDVEQARSALASAQGSGTMTRPAGMQLDPPPSVRWLSDLG